VAHLTTKGRPREVPPLQEVHDDIDTSADLFVKYVNLIRGVSVERSVAITPWPVIFRASWISDDDAFRNVMTKRPKRRQATTELDARRAPLSYAAVRRKASGSVNQKSYRLNFTA